MIEREREREGRTKYIYQCVWDEYITDIRNKRHSIHKKKKGINISSYFNFVTVNLISICHIDNVIKHMHPHLFICSFTLSSMYAFTNAHTARHTHIYTHTFESVITDKLFAFMKYTLS